MTDEHVIEGEQGTITIPAGTIEAIVLSAASSIEGVRPRKRSIDVDGGAVRLELAAPLGAMLPELARDVQRAVTDALGSMCGLSVESVDLRIEELD